MNIVKNYDPDIIGLRVEKILYNNVEGKYSYPKKFVTGWRGSVVINNCLYSGEFGIKENYPIWDGLFDEKEEPLNHFEIDWTEYIKELIKE